jgi:hypothetical protein
MATDATLVTKDCEPAARAFVQQASADQLQQITAGTPLAAHPVVSKLQGTAEQKTEAMRKLVAQQMKRHADLRGMVIRRMAQAGFVSPPAKDAKKEPAGAGKEAAGEKEKKPKKEKGEHKEKGEPKEKGEKGKQAESRAEK